MKDLFFSISVQEKSAEIYPRPGVEGGDSQEHQWPKSDLEVFLCISLLDVTPAFHNPG